MPSPDIHIIHTNDASSVQAGIEERRAFGSHSAHPVAPAKPITAPARGKPLGQVLVEMGALSPEHLSMAVALMAREDARFGDILLANGWINTPDLYAALALQYNCEIADLSTQRPDVRLIDQIGAELCIRNGIVPWKRAGGATIVICARPDQFESLAKNFPASSE